MSMEDDLRRVEYLLEDFDAIPRHGFHVYSDYSPEFRLEHSGRSAANIRYDHMLAEADRRWVGRKGMVAKDIQGLKVWIAGPDAVVRFKKMTEDGRSRNYPTQQEKDYDRGETFPELPPPAVRLTVGYFLDPTETQYIRTQIANRARTVRYGVPQ